MQNNCINDIENIEHLSELDTLNLEHNNISEVANLSGCPNLRTLHLAHNHLETVDDIEHLVECQNLAVLDLSHNNLEDPDIIGIFEQMPHLSVLNLMGNDVVREIRNYRKTLTARIPSLKYLDDRPVFEDDRRIAEAWARGGREAEAAEREAIKQEKRDKERRNAEAFSRMQDDARQRKLDAGGTLPKAACEYGSAPATWTNPETGKTEVIDEGEYEDGFDVFADMPPLEDPDDPLPAPPKPAPTATEDDAVPDPWAEDGSEGLEEITLSGGDEPLAGGAGSKASKAANVDGRLAAAGAAATKLAAAEAGDRPERWAEPTAAGVEAELARVSPPEPVAEIKKVIAITATEDSDDSDDSDSDDDDPDDLDELD